MAEHEVDLEGARVLIVDDTPQNLKILRDVLEPKGYNILVATDGEGALRVAEGSRPDLILLDVQMPGMDGFETCRLLKRSADTEGIPVIFVTAMSDTSSVVEGFDAGGVDYIVKPFQTEEVLARVETHLKIDFLQRDLAESNAVIRRSSERRSAFLAGLSHEFRTPLTAIVGFTNLVKRKAQGLDETHTRNLERVLDSADHLLNLINDILDLSKIEAGKMDVRIEETDVGALAGECCEAIRPMVKPEVALHCEPTPDLRRIDTDRSRLRQILLNLLSNAAKFTPSGSIEVTVVEEGANLAIAVRDTGPGIPEDAMDDLFEEFTQVGGSDPEHKGTGLGLPITRKLAELLGGGITVASRVGEGATFTVRLPAAVPMAVGESR